MMLRCLCSLILLLLTASNTLLAQSCLSGRITDNQSKPLPNVVLMLLDHTEGRLIAHSLSDSLGYFSLKSLDEGKYLLKTQYLGFLEQSIPCSIESNEPLDLGTITLAEEIQGLDEVVIAARRSRPMTKIIAGKLRIEVAESYLSNMGNALEVLRSTPSVRVSRTGEVRLSSLGGTAIYHNGKRIRLSDDALTTYLMALPASSILRIETSANPDASHDADGAGGIINIITRPLDRSGFFLSVGQGFSYWKHLRSSSDLSASYALGAWTLGLTYSQTLGHYAMSYGQERTLLGERSLSQTEDTDKRMPFAARMEVGFRPNAQHSFSLSLSGDLNTGKGYTGTETLIYNQSNQLSQTLWAENDYIKQRKLRYGTGLTHHFTPDKRQTLTTSADWLSVTGGITCHQPNTYTDIASRQSQKTVYQSENQRLIDIYALSSDYTLQAQEYLSLQVGGKASLVRTDNDFLFSQNGQQDHTRSNRFVYQERSLEGYTIGRYSYNGWRASLGLRLEWLHALGKLSAYLPTKQGEQNVLKRLLLFPSASLAYRLGEYELSLAYTRRQDKPKYEELNPFEYLLDERTYWKGNPFLRPQLSDKISLSSSLGRLNLSASYQRISDHISSITDIHSAKATIMTSKNIGLQALWSLESNYHRRLTPWWELSLEVAAYYASNRLSNAPGAKVYSQPSVMLATTQNLQLPWGVALELSGRWYSLRLGGSYELHKSSGAIDLGLSKSWLDGRLKLSLLGTDLLHTERWDSYGTNGDLSLNSWGYGESRQIRMSIRYELGKQKASAPRSAPTETERL